MKRGIFVLGIGVAVAGCFAGCDSDSDDRGSNTVGASGDATAGGAGGEGTSGASTSAGDGGHGTPPLGGAAGAVAGESPGGASESAGGAGASPGGAGAGGTGGVTLEPIQLELPKFTVPGESQITQCVDLDLGNATAFHASSLETTLGEAVYELRVSKLAGGTLATTPYACDPGAASDEGVTTLAFTHARTDRVTFPSGVGFTFDAHQHLRLEVHSLNIPATSAQTSGSVTLTPMPDADYRQEAGVLLLELGGFTLPAGETSDVSAFFAMLEGIGDTSIFEIVGGTHKQGLSVSVSYGANKDALTPLYAPLFDWNQPPHGSVEPERKLGTDGLNLKCSFVNSLPQAVYSGMAADDADCRALVYYYPAIATRACRSSGALTLCCSGSGC